MAEKKNSISGKYLAVVVAASALCFSMSFRVQCVSVFVTPVAEKFGATTTAVITFLSIFNIAALITTALWGRLCQKYGLVKCVAFSGIMVSLAIAGWAWSPTLIWFYLFSALCGIFTAGCGILPASIAVTQWFEEKRGTVMGIVVMFLSVGGVLGNIIFPRIIVSSGWEKSMLWMAVFTLAGTLPFAFVLKTPAECGMKPFGQLVSAAEKDAGPSAEELKGIPAAKALKMPLFYLLWVGILFGCFPMAWMNNLPVWALNRGMDVTQSGMLLSYLSLGGIVTTLLIGMSNDKIGTEKTVALFLGFGSIALLGFIVARSYGAAVVVSILFAIGMAFISTMPQIIVGKVFGPRDYSQLSSIIITAQSVAGIIGPPVISAIFESTGSYNTPLIGLAISWIVSIVVVNYALKRGAALQSQQG